MCQALWAIEFITITIFYSLFCHVIPSILLLPLYLISPKIWYSIESKLYSWSAFGLAIFTKRSGTKISVYGEVEKLRTALRGSSDDMFVVMSNHQTPVDVSVLSMFWQAIDSKSNHFGGVSWVQDFILKVLPTGWMSRVHGDYFLLQPTGARFQQHSSENV